MAPVSRILLVDDDDFVRRYLKDALADGDYSFLEASNGEEALELINQSGAVDLVLLDLLMPRQSGLETLGKLLKRDARQRVLVISSLDTQSLVRQAIETGARGFISKPFHPIEIADEVSRALQ